MPDDPAAANARDERFFREVAATHVMFGLFEGTGWFNREDEGERMMPVWSSLDEAARASTNLLPYAPKGITIEDFVEMYAEQLEQAEIWIAVNPTSDWTGNEYPALRFATLLTGQRS